jgi:hypothetical protein
MVRRPRSSDRVVTTPSGLWSTRTSRPAARTGLPSTAIRSLRGSIQASGEETLVPFTVTRPSLTRTRACDREVKPSFEMARTTVTRSPDLRDPASPPGFGRDFLACVSLFTSIRFRNAPSRRKEFPGGRLRFVQLHGSPTRRPLPPARRQDPPRTQPARPRARRRHHRQMTCAPV